MRTGDVLRRRGIQVSEEHFAALLEDALADRGSPAADPRRVLTQSEARVLAGGGADLSAGTREEPGPGAEAAAALGGLLAGSLTVASTADLLGVDPSRIRHRLLEGSLYGIRVRGRWRLPAFQFGGAGAGAAGGMIPGLDHVLAVLPKDLHPVAVQRWLTTPNPDLAIDDTPVSPLAWLQGGGASGPVVALAADL